MTPSIGAEQDVVARGDLGARGEDLLEALGLREADGGRELVHAVVEAEAVVLEPVARVRAALVRERAHLRGERGVVGRDHAALPRRHLLVGVEREHRGRAGAADALAAALAADGLAGVLDDREPVLVGDRAERLHVARVAEDVHRQDPARARRDRRLDGRRVEHERVGIDVGEDGRRALVEHHVGRGHERDRRGHDLVARADARGAHEQVQAGGAARDGDGVLAAAEGRELLLEVARVGPEAEHAGAQRGEHVLLLERPDVGPREGDLPRRLDLHALAGVVAG